MIGKYKDPERHVGKGATVQRLQLNGRGDKKQYRLVPHSNTHLARRRRIICVLGLPVRPGRFRCQLSQHNPSCKRGSLRYRINAINRKQVIKGKAATMHPGEQGGLLHP